MSHELLQQRKPVDVAVGKPLVTVSARQRQGIEAPPGYGHSLSRIRIADAATPRIGSAGLKRGEDPKGSKKPPPAVSAASAVAGASAGLAGAAVGGLVGSLAGAAVAGAVAAAAKPTLSMSGVGTYADGTESHEKVGYEATVPVGQPKDYCLVQWTKGFAKKGDGTFFKTTDYGNTRDWNYSDWVIDSLDKDPIYWSNATARWNYSLSGKKFTATDDPGPALTSEKGATYAARFKMAIYETAKVPKTTTGSIAAKPVTGFKFWDYSVQVDDKGKFTHPKL